MMRYLGGKKRQAKQIVEAIDDVGAFTSYVEPFCGALWSAVAVMRSFPGRRIWLNDINPHLICMWKAGYEGWNPPAKVTEADYKHYNKTRPDNDPMTGYIGFAWSFGGKFFGGAARTNGKIKGSYKSTVDKIMMLRQNDVRFTCGSFDKVKPAGRSVVYLDPPYIDRTHQSRMSNEFDYAAYYTYAEQLSRRHVVIATEFRNERNWAVLHNYGDTVVRHLNAKPRDGTVELLMRVQG